MTAYRHAFEAMVEYQFGGPDPEQWVTPECSVTEGDTGCGCSDPEPDPSSPCGFDYDDGDPALCGQRGEAAAHDERFYHFHPHIATRCLNCGHALVTA